MVCLYILTRDSNSNPVGKNYNCVFHHNFTLKYNNKFIMSNTQIKLIHIAISYKNTQMKIYNFPLVSFPDPIPRR